MRSQVRGKLHPLVLFLGGALFACPALANESEERPSDADAEGSEEPPSEAEALESEAPPSPPETKGDAATSEPTDPVHADPSRICVDSHERAQLERRDGGLKEAERLLIECSSSACSPLIQADCSTWRNEVMAAIPTLVVQVRRGEQDVIDATLTIDDSVAAEALDGRPLAVDPGKHVVRVTLLDGETLEKELVFSEGEKSRVVSFNFEPLHPPEPESKAAEQTSPPPAQVETYRPVPLASPLLLGLSIASAGLATGFGVHALRLKSQANERCAPLCSAEDKSRLTTAAATSDVFLGISIVSLAGASVLYLLRPRVEKPVEETKKNEMSWSLGGSPRGVYGAAHLLF